MSENLKHRMLRGDVLTGTFLKTPAFQLVEVLAMSDFDFIALDAEHSPFDRGTMDACLGVARAMNFPTLVRIPDCLLYTSPSPRDLSTSRMPSSA